MLISACPVRSLAEDDLPALGLLAALVELARRDANAGDAEAAAWLAELQAARPRSLRLLATDDPRRIPGRYGAAA